MNLYDPLSQMVLGALLGTLLSIITTILIERLRQPDLELQIVESKTIEYQDKRPAKKAKFLYVCLINKPLIKGFRWLTREIATNCHGFITFHYADNGRRALVEEMNIRWSDTPEIVTSYVVIDDKWCPIINPKIATSVDVLANSSQKLDVAARFDDEPDCYGWNNDSYQHEWRNPERKLGADRYLVRVAIVTPNRTLEGFYVLFNPPTIKEFRLEKASKDDIRKIREAEKL